MSKDSKRKWEVIVRTPKKKMALPEIESEYKKGLKASTALLIQATKGLESVDATERLISLGCAICSNLRSMWSDLKHRPVLEEAATRSHYFPLIHTNIEKERTRVGKAQDREAKIPIEPEEMLKQLVLKAKPGAEKRKSGRRRIADELNAELDHFVNGVTLPGTLILERWTTVKKSDYESPLDSGKYIQKDKLPDKRDVWHSSQGSSTVEVEYGYYERKDAIDEETRTLLLSDSGKTGRWADAFANYVEEYREDLLTRDGMSGKFSELVEIRTRTIQAKEQNNENPWNDFKKVVRDRLKMYKEVIRGAQEDFQEDKATHLRQKG